MRFCVVGAFFVVACSPNHSEDSAPELGIDGFGTFEVENNVEVLTNALLAGSGTGVALANGADSDLSPLDLGDASKAFFFPRGCLATTHDAAARQVTYVFSGCTGPRGLAKLAGTYVVKYAASQGSLALDISSDGLKLNGATVSTRATATIRTSGLARSMKWNATASGTTRSGILISRTVARTLKWTVGTPCITLDGASEGSFGATSLKVAVQNLQRCRASCPEAGGSIELVNRDGTYVLSFDGSNFATLDGPKGKSTIPLSCTR